MTTATQRPGTVTLLVVLVVISGILQVIAGLAVVFLRDNARIAQETGSPTVGLWLGIVTIVCGLIYLAVAKGLANGNGFSRVLVAIVSVLNIIAGVWAFLTQIEHGRWSGLGTVIFGLIVLAILYSRRSNAFFAGR